MHVAKVIEIVASSDKSFDDAVKLGLGEASQTLRGITGVDIIKWTADVENNRIVRYKTTMHVALAVEHPVATP